MDTPIPPIIQEKLAEISASLQVRQAQAEQEEKQRIEAEQQARLERFERFKASVLPLLPDYIHPYIGPYEQSDYEGNSSILLVSIDGLAPMRIRFQFEELEWVEVAQVWIDDEDYTPSWHWSGWPNRYQGSREGLEMALLQAKAQAERFAKAQNEQADSQRKAAEKELSAQNQAAAEQEEISQLMRVVEADPVLLHMLKAFLYIDQQRGNFYRQIEHAQEWGGFTERHLTQKLETVQSRLAETRREVEDGQSRLYALEDELGREKKKSRS